MTAENHDLAGIPDGAVLRSVTAGLSSFDHRRAVRVSLTDKVSHDGVAGVDYVDQPTFVQIPTTFTSGHISVDIASRLRPDAPEEARGFVGIAYRIGRGQKPSFEAVYLRPANGWHTAPTDGPRKLRAIQYFAYPDWPYNRLRDERPDGGYEAAADIRLDTWIRLGITVHARSLSADVDGTTVLEVPHTLVEPTAGAVGLFVDIGTDAHFSNLTISHAD
ncbi:hypothetical protein [Microbacterium pumilum]|uniref:Uncharacterized protein n=1 Tax=Microbacterium pumilum TaxID=344165 RepID=A0ABN2RRX1_9MICO